MRSPREYESPLCAQVDGDVWFPEKSDSAAPAKRICGSCIHKVECAEWGIKHEQFGVWGGLVPRERQQARRQLNIILETPKVEDWLC
jgi:WhiB family redox-sensing transcriptional regulator